MPEACVLLIEDEPDVAEVVRTFLREAEFEVIWESTAEGGLRNACSRRYDVILTDLRLGGASGFDVVCRLREEGSGVPVIVMTGQGTTDTAIEAMKFGAYDYILKPLDPNELLRLLRGAVEAGRRRASVVPPPAGEVRPDAVGLVGGSRVMQTLYKEIGQLAPRAVPVLIRGETGTGKELVARALWRHGPREKRPFVAVNCAALPEGLLESELFGHERGAFTGADGRRIGRFEQAHGGTMFLDEIGDLSPSVQVKLLRVLQEQRFQRVGGMETIAVDVRIIAATHRDLEQLRAEGRFREDLYFRLAVAVLRLPPLRERLDDLELLVAHFARQHGPDLGNPTPMFLPEALARLHAHAWPGNVRELENAVRKAILQARGYPVTAESVEAVLLPAARSVVRGGADPVAGPGEPTLRERAAQLLRQASAGEVADARWVMLNEAEKELLGQTMERAKGNLSLAARWLGMSRLTLRAKLRQFGFRSDASDAADAGGVDDER